VLLPLPLPLPLRGRQQQQQQNLLQNLVVVRAGRRAHRAAGQVGCSASHAHGRLLRAVAQQRVEW